MAISRVTATVAATMLAVGIALVAWTLIGDHGMRWGVIGSALIGFAAVEAYLSLLDDDQRGPTRALLYLLTPLLSGEHDKHGSPVLPVTSDDADGVWFTPTSKVVRIEDSYDTMRGHSYDHGTFVQLVTDHDAVGRRFDRLDVVRDGHVTSFTVPDNDADEAVSLRDGLVCVAYVCRSVDDLLD